ncbi:complex I subunit 5 family protein [Alkalimonas amylolytica]|uniref:Formate hydrogenlyase subunit 3/Multisubunit Na+/H+ antiporter, MnhD subunit n=1 Tax=Alkalimonas amylolytica TaxID=152573 RepID=A0A1H3XFW4_ALKAM|nr:proton-conducting transporter membrane subunit [Alkalimonas amylolytica]SDZ97564.1 Formate hydrogenlyase subunit 3/Multisubunit Na+/H+ antiporter, MnhD subunit [Alkalimonas amylolytica]
MSFALAAVLLPLLAAVLALCWRSEAARLVWLSTLFSLLLALAALWQVVTFGPVSMQLGGWQTGLAIRWHLNELSALLLLMTALIHSLVASYSFSQWRDAGLSADFWPLSALLQAALSSLFLSVDLFNWYVTLELLGLAAVALVLLSGKKALQAAMRYLLLSLAGSLCYLLGVALLYGHYGWLDVPQLAVAISEEPVDHRLALWLITAGLMLKAALWPLHVWLPAAHAAAPAPVSALLSALVVKGPLFMLYMIWGQLAGPELAVTGSWLFLLTGSMALVVGGWSALRTPYAKVMVAYSTVAQLGYGLLALGLMLHLTDPAFTQALFLFVLAHALAKTSTFLAVGEMQLRLGGKRLSTYRGASQTMPLAMFAVAVAGGSLIGLPPSGGFVAKWHLLLPLWQHSQLWWLLPVILAGTLLSAAYIFRLVVLAFNRAKPVSPDFAPVLLPQWLALLPALLVWMLAFASGSLLSWLGG